MLYNKIHDDMLLAMKEDRKEDKIILSLVYGQLKNKAIELRTKDLSDNDTISVIKKQIKMLEDERALFEKLKRQNNIDTINAQIKLLSEYLPQQLSEDKIKEIIDSLEDKSIPSIMKHFKTNYNDQVDMGLVSKIARGV